MLKQPDNLSMMLLPDEVENSEIHGGFRSFLRNLGVPECREMMVSKWKPLIFNMKTATIGMWDSSRSRNIIN